MKKLLTTICLMLIVVTATAFNQSAVNLEHTYRFPDFGFMLSPNSYHGPVFRLSSDYPKKLPTLDEDVKKILKIDFKKDWKKYALAVRNYTFKDNINQDDNSLSFNFRGKQNQRWFHMPWQHWGVDGREGFHGLTKEGQLDRKTLSTQQTTYTTAYAVGFYNRQGGYAIGQVWDNANNPDLSYVVKNGFPEGTVVAKFLFTTLDSTEVPYLVNPIEWYAYVYECDIPSNTHCSNEQKKLLLRQKAKVRLLQMDIMVKDPRATDSNAWVFGTFVYNGKLNHKNRWNNLQPVGLMWGNDPEVTLSQTNPKPTETKINKNLKQTQINTDATMPAQHLGWNSRLNGPADNSISSCMSCHSTAQFPAVSAIMPCLDKNNLGDTIPVPVDGSMANSDWMRWFRNFSSNVAFNEGQAMTTDFSLQLSKSIQNFIEYRSQSEQGCYNVGYWPEEHKVSRGHVLQVEESPSDNKDCR